MVSNLDSTLLEKGVVLDSTSHIDIVYFAPSLKCRRMPSADGNNSTDSATDASGQRDAT